jgi:hypothetical protein
MAEAYIQGFGGIAGRKEKTSKIKTGGKIILQGI